MDTLSNIFGDAQNQVVTLDGIVGDDSDAYEITITDSDGNATTVSAQYDTDVATTTAAIKADDGNATVLDLVTVQPTWDSRRNRRQAGKGSFTVTATAVDNGSGGGTAAAIVKKDTAGTDAQDYIADTYTIDIDGTSVDVDFRCHDCPSHSRCSECRLYALCKGNCSHFRNW